MKRLFRKLLRKKPVYEPAGIIPGQFVHNVGDTEYYGQGNLDGTYEVWANHKHLGTYDKNEIEQFDYLFWKQDQDASRKRQLQKLGVNKQCTCDVIEPDGYVTLIYDLDCPTPHSRNPLHERTIEGSRATPEHHSVGGMTPHMCVCGKPLSQH